MSENLGLVSCPDCGGTGDSNGFDWHENQKCSTCNGVGRISSKRAGKLTITIPQADYDRLQAAEGKLAAVRDVLDLLRSEYGAMYRIQEASKKLAAILEGAE